MFYNIIRKKAWQCRVITTLLDVFTLPMQAAKKTSTIMAISPIAVAPLLTVPSLSPSRFIMSRPERLAAVLKLACTGEWTNTPTTRSVSPA